MKKAVKAILICFYTCCILGIIFGAFIAFPHWALEQSWGESFMWFGRVLGGLFLLGGIVAGFLVLHDWAFSKENGGKK